LWMAQYSGLGLWAYDPESGPRNAALLPGAYNRPQSVTWDERNRLVVVSALADAAGGSCLGIHDPAAGTATAVELPLGAGQSVPVVFAHDGVVYLGGGDGGAESPAGEVAAYDARLRTLLWRLDTGHGARVTSLTVAGRYLYVALFDGGFRVIDLAKRRIVHSAEIAFTRKTWSLVRSRNRVLAATPAEVLRIEAKTFAFTQIVSGLSGAWYGGGMDLATDERGRLYTMKDRNLVQIEVA
ncbi:NHL repeat-containing protein, partial [Mycobacterium tuberculosis]|uniref:PQQ-binding-like beta-propeller repeat protein n=1 Tax=Mycobacterium tuberculosis TaxID=1773 RepID=UPI000ABDB6B8